MHIFTLSWEWFYGIAIFSFPLFFDSCHLLIEDFLHFLLLSIFLSLLDTVILAISFWRIVIVIRMRWCFLFDNSIQFIYSLYKFLIQVFEFVIFQPQLSHHFMSICQFVWFRFVKYIYRLASNESGINTLFFDWLWLLLELFMNPQSLIDGRLKLTILHV